jgi:hypothetical protein
LVSDEYCFVPIFVVVKKCQREFTTLSSTSVSKAVANWRKSFFFTGLWIANQQRAGVKTLLTTPNGEEIKTSGSLTILPAWRGETKITQQPLQGFCFHFPLLHGAGNY